MMWVQLFGEASPPHNLGEQKHPQFVGTVENHGNTKIMEAEIFIECRDFAKMPYFAMFLAKMQ